MIQPTYRRSNEMHSVSIRHSILQSRNYFCHSSL